MLEFSIITISSFVTMLDSITRYIGKFCFKKDIGKVLPIFSIIYGVALGICGFYTPNVEMGANLIEAVFIGLSAGAAATGINQVGKQLNKKDDQEVMEENTQLVMNALGEFIESIKTNKDDVNNVDEEDYIENEDYDYWENTEEVNDTEVEELTEQIEKINEEESSDNGEE
jgi:hypothetical protein